MSSKTPDIVIFVGAGFSCGADLPVMDHFGESSAEELGALRKLPRRGGAVPMLIEAGQVFSAFQDYCKRSAILNMNEINNLETVFCIAEAMREANVDPVELDLLPPRFVPLSDVVEKIQLWIWKIYNRCRFLDKSRPLPDRAPYDRFFRAMRERSAQLTVLSTNYDLLFEWLASENDVRCQYPTSCSERISVGTGGTSYLADPDDSLAPMLCKLHGSINYFQPPAEPGRILVVADAGSETRIGKSGPSRWPGDSPCVFAVEAIWELRKRSLVPAIIPPTYAKLAGNKWLREVWHQAFEALRTARIILFIGYSMPESDGFMRALIHAAMASHHREPPPTIYVVDPKDKVRRRYCRLFPHLMARTKARYLRDLDEKELDRILR